MTWHCDEHGKVIPQATGTSYRCPCCTARVVWRDAEPRWASAGCKCDWRTHMLGDGCAVCQPDTWKDMLAEQAEGEG